ncbi:GntR family transcriptional regulator [Eubacterium sp. 1001713B170207_170306_E7]|uniref:GntR family transcriptional regulator n=1 Tax=Eubacterium sp. 1001713B170207_170306_E7 TaxID=2787097 RepID=UPI00189A48E2|nr:GntR family transcriptional regulator [Eubacterium sp. 1001713B170207_170306_E7]
MDIPIYEKIANDIKEKISLEVLKPNDPIPSEAALCETYNVSRLTVRKSLEMLVRDGLVYLVQGKGHFVRKTNGSDYRLTFNEVSFETAAIDQIRIVDVDVIESTKDLVYTLKIHPNTRVLRIRRVLYEKKQPIGYDIKYIPYYPGFPLIEKELEARDFVEILADRVSPYSVQIDLKVTPQTAGQETAGQLGMDEGGGILMVSQLLTDIELGVVGYCETFYNAKHVKLSAEWSR